MPARIRVVLPYHLANLAGCQREVALEVTGAVTANTIVDALEQAYPPLRNTVRDPANGRRRPFLRFFACEDDISHRSPDQPLPDAVSAGREPFYIIGAIVGG